MAEAKQIVLITGSNTGLGYEAIKSLISTPRPYEILMGTRTLSNGERAREQLKTEVSSTPSSISVVQADVNSDESLENLVKHIEEKYGKLDVLINNAGAGFDGKIQDGSMSIREAWNASWDTNVAGTQVLTTLAMPLLLHSSDPRLLFITSGTASLAETEVFDQPHLARLNAAPEAGWPKEKMVNPITSYRSTKTGLNMLMREWTRILRNDGVKVWAVSPGFLATGLGGVGRETLKKVSRLVLFPFDVPSGGVQAVADLILCC